MHILLTVAAVFVLAVGIYLGQRDPKVNPQINKDVLSQQVKSEETEGGVESDTPKSDINNKNVDPGGVIETKIPTPYPTTGLTGANLDVYKYPNATIVSLSSNELKLQSPDNPDTVTDWFKLKIQGSGMAVKTFIKTKANDKILNTLVGADDEKEVKSEISKNPGDPSVYITVKVIYK